MNKEIKLADTFGAECAIGDRAVRFLQDDIKPIMDQDPSTVIVFDLAGIVRINSSFANALFGNFYAAYGDSHIRVKNVNPNLMVLLVAAFEHGKSLIERNQDLLQNDKESFWSKLFAALKNTVKII